ncbi:MAG: AMP-dependent synthetase [Sphingomonadaceae bacterium]|nr:AMP-dependent synthetase [Sphingomonadaceae bacterium]
MHYAQLRQVRSELTGPGGPFEIVEAEVLGHRMKVYKNAPPSGREFWLSTAAFGPRDYLVYEGERITYTQAHDQVRAVTAWLWEQGVRPGDRVAIAMRNYPEWMLIYWACLCLGVAAVGTNAWWTAEELEYALTDSAPKVIFADAERLKRLAECSAPAARVPTVAVRADSGGTTAWSEVIAHPGAMPEVQVDPDSDACIFYTSGTTGHPKGAQLTHRGCVSNLMNLLYAGASSGMATERGGGAAIPTEPPIPATLVTTPLFHVTANNCAAYAATAQGGKMVLMYRWDAGAALKLIETERCNGLSGVPVMARELINHPDFDKYDTSSLLNMSGGGAQVPPDQVGAIDQKIPSARPSTGYGMTETCGIITSVGGDFFVDRPSSAGPSMPNFDVKCVDDDGNEVPQGEVGELWVKGSSVIKGYLNRPDANAASFTDGWLHTGDVARIDEDGFIFIVDRKKDMVLRGGENVFCTEVEAGIYRHPAVAECCVFGVPDERLGEEVGVAIVLKPGEALDAEALRAHCGGVMAKHKVPRYVWFLDEALPRNANGKFLRRELRDELARQTAEA